MKSLDKKDKAGLGLGTIAIISVAFAVIPGVISAVADVVKKKTDEKNKKTE